MQANCLRSDDETKQMRQTWSWRFIVCWFSFVSDVSIICDNYIYISIVLSKKVSLHSVWVCCRGQTFTPSREEEEEVRQNDGGKGLIRKRGKSPSSAGKLPDCRLQSCLPSKCNPLTDGWTSCCKWKGPLVFENKRKTLTRTKLLGRIWRTLRLPWK